MEQLLVPTRRRFLVGAAALFCAPAIIRTGSLMPIKPPALARVFLSAQAIADEVAHQMYLQGAAPKQFGMVFSSMQHNVDVAHELLKAEKIETSLRHIGKMLANVAGPLSPAPPLPFAVLQSAIGNYCGVQVRYLSDYDLARDELLHRFDISHS